MKKCFGTACMLLCVLLLLSAFAACDRLPDEQGEDAPEIDLSNSVATDFSLFSEDVGECCFAFPVDDYPMLVYITRDGEGRIAEERYVGANLISCTQIRVSYTYGEDGYLSEILVCGADPGNLFVELYRGVFTAVSKGISVADEVYIDGERSDNTISAEYHSTGVLKSVNIIDYLYSAYDEQGRRTYSRLAEEAEVALVYEGDARCASAGALILSDSEYEMTLRGERGFVTEVLMKNDASLAEYRIAYGGSDGHLTKCVMSHGTIDGSARVDSGYSYAYDAEERLIRAARIGYDADGNADACDLSEYTYDENGVRISVNASRGESIGVSEKEGAANVAVDSSEGSGYTQIGGDSSVGGVFVPIGGDAPYETLYAADSSAIIETIYVFESAGNP